MAMDCNLWAIVLAAGEGVRLRELTTRPDGQCVPKQYCSLNGSPSLLRQALARAYALAGRNRTTAVVAESHRQWWQPDLAELPRSNVIVQPCNRGTACGLLLPLLTILGRDPDAVVLVLPSDHVVADEDVLARAAACAVREVQEGPDSGSLILLGVEPQWADQGYGWVVPGEPAELGSRAVVSFLEKPGREAIEGLMRRGALWNSFIFVARGLALLTLFESVMPWLVRLFRHTLVGGGGDGRRPSLEGLFEQLPTLDFSQSVLQQAPDRLRVLPVPPCGWSDVGTPERVADWVARGIPCPFDEAPAGSHAPPLDLAVAIGQRRGRDHVLETRAGTDPS